MLPGDRCWEVRPLLRGNAVVVTCVIVVRCGRCWEVWSLLPGVSLLPGLVVVARCGCCCEVMCIMVVARCIVVARWSLLPGGCCCEVYHCHQVYSLCRERVDVHDLHGAEQDKAIDDVEVFASKQQQSL